MKKNKKIFLTFYIILIIINILLTISLSFNLIKKDIYGNIIPRHKITFGVLLDLIYHILVLLLGCFIIINSNNLVLIWAVLIFVGILPIIIIFTNNAFFNNLQTSGNIFIWLIQNGIFIF